jgi:predicted acetyltransferase
VDLYKVGLEPYCYSICLHGTKEVIGDIKYRGELDEITTLSTGNIGYYIAKQYRCNGYVSEALQILSDKLYEDGINTIYIAAKPDNIASRRVAEKFGGKIMHNFSSEFSVIYKCDLNKIKQSKKR